MYDIDKPKYRALVLRKNFGDLEEWIDRAQTLFAPAGGRKSGDSFVFPSGAKIRMGHLKDDQAFTKYQGHNYAKILVEELSQISRLKDYKTLLGSNRSVDSRIKPQVFCTTNPDEPGLEWIKDHWDIPDLPDFEQIYTTEKDGRSLVFIPSKVEDNPALMESDPAYITLLESFKESDPERYQAWRHGNWQGYGIEGAYYRNHLLRAEQEGRIVDGLYEPQLPVYTWCDIGKGENYAIGYFQKKFNQWAIIDYDELKDEEGLHEGIKRMKEKPYVYERHYAPHDMDVKDFGAKKSRKEIAQELGIDFDVLPQSSVHEGIDLVKVRFATLWFDKTNTELFRKRLSRYRKEWDEKRGKWKNEPFHDINSHAADMLRYWAVTDVQDVDAQQMMRIQYNRANRRSLK